MRNMQEIFDLDIEKLKSANHSLSAYSALVN